MSTPTSTARLPLALAWLAVAIWAPASLALAAFGDRAPLVAALVGPGLLAVVIMLAITGSGWRGALLFAATAFVIALALENLSIATGVPFGFFSHTDQFGAKIGQVPAAVALGYFMYGYPAWLLARLVTGSATGRIALLTPLVAAFVVTQFDLAHDPIGSTVQGYWHYRHATGFNGVPLTNFLGWLVTATVIFLAWLPIERRWSRTPDATNLRFWSLPVLFWLVTAAQYPLMFAATPRDGARAGTTQLAVADIHEGAAIVATVVLGFVIVLAVSQLFEAQRGRLAPLD